MKTKISIIAFTLLAAGAAIAGEPRGVQRWEGWWEISGADAIPVPCIGPEIYMEGTEHVVVWEQVFTSPTGADHFMGHWKSEVELHDQYGRTWIGSGDAFSQDITLGVAGTHKYVAHYLFKPVFGDGPMWQMRNVGMVKVNADGTIVVDRPPYSTWEQVERCLPAKKK